MFKAKSLSRVYWKGFLLFFNTPTSLRSATPLSEGNREHIKLNYHTEIVIFNFLLRNRECSISRFRLVLVGVFFGLRERKYGNFYQV